MDAPEFVESALTEAARLGASDIYFLPDSKGVELRMRIAGEQRQFKRVEGELAQQCMARLKVVSGMLTYKSRIAQDGSARLPGGLEFRFSTLPTTKGERISVRIMNAVGRPKLLSELGYEPEVLCRLRQMLDRQNGLIVLTGPTGCGKTTTLYAMISELIAAKQDPASILSIEDPVEMEIEGISQCSVTRSCDSWGYCEALKAALRHDVKTLVVGEMRDKEIVRVALDAALSGHRVITTYHAGDIAGVYSRLLLGGIEPFLLATVISGVLAQRLVVAKGYDGRRPVAATLLPDDAWMDFVAGNPSPGELKTRAAAIPGADLKGVLRRMAAAELV